MNGTKLHYILRFKLAEFAAERIGIGSLAQVHWVGGRTEADTTLIREIAQRLRKQGREAYDGRRS